MRILMAAGGTGGHVMPALSVAHAIRDMDAKAEILFVGTPEGMENDLLAGTDFSLEVMRVKGLKGKGWFEKVRNLLYLPGAFFASWKILRRFSPQAVFGIGGYASGPILLLASVLGRKTAILEPNAVPGFANRFLSRFVGRVFVAFEEALKQLPKSKSVVSGNPIRKEILEVSPPATNKTSKGILVFGGSQGAQRINEAVMDMLSSVVAKQWSCHFIHQTGVSDVERVTKAYQKHGIEAEVQPFFSNMAEAYRKADLVVARSGSSVLEIAACGRPAILVPYPYAADDHQHANARVVERAGCGMIIENHLLTGETLFAAVSKLLGDDDKFQEMSRATHTLRFDRAAQTIASQLHQWGMGGVA